MITEENKAGYIDELKKMEDDFRFWLELLHDTEVKKEFIAYKGKDFWQGRIWAAEDMIKHVECEIETWRDGKP